MKEYYTAHKDMTLDTEDYFDESGDFNALAIAPVKYPQL